MKKTALSHIAGSIHLFFLIVIAVVIVAIIALPAYQKSKSDSSNLDTIQTPLPTEEETPESTMDSPTPSPTQVPSTPSATPKATLVSTPKPTQQPVSGPPGSGYSFLNVSTSRGNFSVSVVSIDMGGVRMITDTAIDNDCQNNCATKPLADFVSANGGFAGINGTYFCPPDYASCSGKVNSFDFPVYNTRLSKWINQGNLFWNDRSIIYQDGGGMHFKKDAKSFSGGLNAGIVSSPGLVEGGNIIVEQFPLTDQQRVKGTRGGIGLRGNVVYLAIARSADMIDFAHIFKSLGADFAMNLDGGGSSALWFGGYKAGPGRSLPNAIIFAR